MSTIGNLQEHVAERSQRAPGKAMRKLMLALADPSTGKTSEKMARQFLVTLVDAFERMPSKQEMEGKEAPDWRAKLRAIGIRPRRARAKAPMLRGSIERTRRTRSGVPPAKAPMLRGSIERGRCGNREWFAQSPGG